VKVAVVGLDCADPELVFDELLDEMPNLAQLVEQGAHGPIRSTDPPETVPAWMAFATSKNPGRLGFTGFRNRAWQRTSKGRTGNYGEGFIASSLHVDEPTLWEIAGDAEKEVVLLGVPQTFPVEPVNGALVAGLLSPPGEAPYTHPPELADEIEAEVGEYLVDVPEPGADPAQVVADARRMTDQRFDVAEHLATTRDWDLLFMVAMGPDRVHHAAWSTHDPDHPLHDPDGEDLLVDYYRHLDQRIGDFVDQLDDDTAILVVSDHGAKAGQGSICLNDWLREEGYLELETEPEEPEAFDPDLVDWSNTQAWARAGYAGRIHVNVEGREPEGTVDPLDYEDVRDEIRGKLETMTIDGRGLGTRVLKPREVHHGPHVDEGPDLLCYAGDLAYRCDERVGNGAVLREAEPGRDEAVHDYHGLFVLADPEGRYTGRVEDMELVDGAPTVLELLGLPVPSDMEGRVLQPDGSLEQA
jgi:predicted AlkP superfamily phosphohydrolase/phosphomutase